MLRYAAYKQYTWLIHNYLEKEKVIPPCALWTIGNKFPSQDNKYENFVESDIDMKLRLKCFF